MDLKFADLTSYVSFDLETTSCNSKTCEIIEIAAVKVEKGQIVDTYHQLVKPSVPIPIYISKLTGITNQMVSDAPNIENVLPDFLNFIGEYLLIGHNISSFDLHILNRFSKTVTGSYISCFYIDTLFLAKKLFPDIPHGLEFIACYCKVQIDNVHRALDDSVLVHECFSYMLANFSKETIVPKQFIPPALRSSVKTSHVVSSNSLQTLHGFLLGIVADNVLTESEVLSLWKWMKDNKNLSGNFPYDRIYEIIERALSDNVLEQCELDEMLHLFQQYVSPIDTYSTIEGVDSLQNKIICLTGNFNYGERKTLEEAIERSGGVCKSTVTKKTDYVVVGSCGSSDWSCGAYGNKVKKALELQEKGSKIQILKEENFIKLLNDPENNAVAEQFTLFDVPANTVFKRIQDVIDDIIASHDLPPQSIHLYSNISHKTGEEISKSVCIFEPEYPPNPMGKEKFGKNYVIMKLEQKDDTYVLYIRYEQAEMIATPGTAIEKNLKSDKVFLRVIFQQDDDSIFKYIEKNILYCLANYKSSSSFGCCSRFIECSDAKTCVHENKIYSMGCKYRANLDMGKIFYGKNKNI